MAKIKITGSGNSVFRQLYKITQKKQKAEKKIQQKITIKKEKFSFDKDRDFSKWELKIINKLKKSNLNFETKFRKFPLQVKQKKFVYVPDLLVLDFLFNGKKILIEAHEEISEEDVTKYRKFRSFYGRAYHLIMIVNDHELRKWNTYDQGKEAIFHDIWVNDNVKELILKLKQMKSNYEKEIEEYDTRAICPKPPDGLGCGRISEGYNEIDKWFGYRGKKRQSLCRQCRSKHAKLQRKKTKR